MKFIPYPIALLSRPHDFEASLNPNAAQSYIITWHLSFCSSVLCFGEHRIYSYSYGKSYNCMMESVLSVLSLSANVNVTIYLFKVNND